jgi:hypothetical protein
MQCVILWRNTQNGCVGFITETDRPDEIAVFADRDEAESLADRHPVLRAFPHQIVDLEDL